MPASPSRPKRHTRTSPTDRLSMSSQRRLLWRVLVAVVAIGGLLDVVSGMAGRSTPEAADASAPPTAAVSDRPLMSDVEVKQLLAARSARPARTVSRDATRPSVLARKRQALRTGAGATGHHRVVVPPPAPAQPEPTAPTAAPTTPAPVVPVGDPRTIARAMLAEYGWSDGEFPCLDALWNSESGWNPYATNAYSGAYGIPQALPPEKMASAGADWATNPVTQIRWGLGYIVASYGSPCGAESFKLANGWY